MLCPSLAVNSAGFATMDKLVREGPAPYPSCFQGSKAKTRQGKVKMKVSDLCFSIRSTGK